MIFTPHPKTYFQVMLLTVLWPVEVLPRTLVDPTSDDLVTLFFVIERHHHPDNQEPLQVTLLLRLVCARVRVGVLALKLWIVISFCESQSSDKSSQRISCIRLMEDLQNMIPAPFAHFQQKLCWPQKYTLFLHISFVDHLTTNSRCSCLCICIYLSTSHIPAQLVLVNPNRITSFTKKLQNEVGFCKKLTFLY